jgi:hypothetical protein
MHKWSLDAYANGKPRPLEIGGMLRDDEEKFLCIFSCSIGIKEINKTEVLTIQKALILSSNCYCVSFMD